MRAAAYAIESVAEPLPAFASTTSVPAFWIRVVSCSVSSPVKVTDGVTCTEGHRWRGAPLNRWGWLEDPTQWTAWLIRPCSTQLLLMVVLSMQCGVGALWHPG